MSDETMAVELFRLRYELRLAVAGGKMTPNTRRALDRFRELAGRRGDLLFEFRRWCVQLELADAA